MLNTPVLTALLPMHVASPCCKMLVVRALTHAPKVMLGHCIQMPPQCLAWIAYCLVDWAAFAERSRRFSMSAKTLRLRSRRSRTCRLCHYGFIDDTGSAALALPDRSQCPPLLAGCAPPHRMPGLCSPASWVDQGPSSCFYRL